MPIKSTAQISEKTEKNIAITALSGPKSGRIAPAQNTNGKRTLGSNSTPNKKTKKSEKSEKNRVVNRGPVNSVSSSSDEEYSSDEAEDNNALITNNNNNNNNKKENKKDNNNDEKSIGSMASDDMEEVEDDESAVEGVDLSDAQLNEFNNVHRRTVHEATGFDTTGRMVVELKRLSPPQLKKAMAMLGALSGIFCYRLDVSENDNPTESEWTVSILGLDDGVKMGPLTMVHFEVKNKKGELEDEYNVCHSNPEKVEWEEDPESTSSFYLMLAQSILGLTENVAVAAGRDDYDFTFQWLYVKLYHLFTAAKDCHSDENYDSTLTDVHATIKEADDGMRKNVVKKLCDTVPFGVTLKQLKSGIKDGTTSWDNDATATVNAVHDVNAWVNMNEDMSFHTMFYNAVGLKPNVFADGISLRDVKPFGIMNLRDGRPMWKKFYNPKSPMDLERKKKDCRAKLRNYGKYTLPRATATVVSLLTLQEASVHNITFKKPEEKRAKVIAKRRGKTFMCFVIPDIVALVQANIRAAVASKVQQGRAGEGNEYKAIPSIDDVHIFANALRDALNAYYKSDNFSKMGLNEEQARTMVRDWLKIASAKNTCKIVDSFMADNDFTQQFQLSESYRHILPMWEDMSNAVACEVMNSTDDSLLTRLATSNIVNRLSVIIDRCYQNEAITANQLKNNPNKLRKIPHQVERIINNLKTHRVPTKVADELRHFIGDTSFCGEILTNHILPSKDDLGDKYSKVKSHADTRVKSLSTAGFKTFINCVFALTQNQTDNKHVLRLKEVTMIDSKSDDGSNTNPKSQFYNTCALKCPEDLAKFMGALNSVVFEVMDKNTRDILRQYIASSFKQAGYDGTGHVLMLDPKLKDDTIVKAKYPTYNVGKNKRTDEMPSDIICQTTRGGSYCEIVRDNTHPYLRQLKSIKHVTTKPINFFDTVPHLLQYIHAQLHCAIVVQKGGRRGRSTVKQLNTKGLIHKMLSNSLTIYGTPITDVEHITSNNSDAMLSLWSEKLKDEELGCDDLIDESWHKGTYGISIQRVSNAKTNNDMDIDEDDF